MTGAVLSGIFNCKWSPGAFGVNISISLLAFLLDAARKNVIWANSGAWELARKCGVYIV